MPPPRIVSGQPMLGAEPDDANQVVARSRQHDAQRLDLVDAGVGGIERAGNAIESHLADGLLFEIPTEVFPLPGVNHRAKVTKGAVAVRNRDRT